MRVASVLATSLLLATPVAAQQPGQQQAHAVARTARSTPATSLRLSPIPREPQSKGRGDHFPYVDAKGVIRWRDTKAEVRLFGANYAITSSSDYRAAGYISSDRKKMIDEDVAQMARMGWNGMRLAFWGDWQSSDRQGNLLHTDHLDLLDYLVAKARERGISILLNPIHTYDAGWPDAERDAFPGFSAHIAKSKLGTDSTVIAAQVNWIQQLLRHVNPYTGVALKDEPAIVFIEMINEPIHHPEDMPGSVRYIDALVNAVRSTGSRAITFHNVSQDFAIAPAIRDSKVQGASFGWYPTGLNSGHELRGNYLRTVDDYPALDMPELAGRPRIVYEFDSADLQTGYMYPAMIRTLVGGGVQMADMFAYDMLETASRNLGWQTHRLNMVYTPRKAMSSVIAAEAMKRLPLGRKYGGYPGNETFGPFRVSYEQNLGEMATDDAFLYGCTTDTRPPHPEKLVRIAGCGSSPVVSYEGTGIYFLDKVRDGVWRLELYPDAVDVDDPFVQPRRDKIVTRALWRACPMTVRLPGLGDAFSVQALMGGAGASSQAANGTFTVTPGVYVLSARGPVDTASMPKTIANIGFREYHAPPRDSPGDRVLADPLPEYVTDRPVTIGARVVSEVAPDSVALWLRPVGRPWFSRVPMVHSAAYEYRAVMRGDSLAAGPYDYMISVHHGDSTVTYPEGVHRSPWSWDFSASHFWSTRVVGPKVAVQLLHPLEDAPRLAFTRIGDAGRQGIFRLVPSQATGGSALHLELPHDAKGESPDDYTASLVVMDRVLGRGETIGDATAVRVRVRALDAGDKVHLALMEKDGTTWGTVIAPDTSWREITIPLTSFTVTKGVKLPLGFPGQWNYWVGPAEGRGGAGDHIRVAGVERLQLSMRKADGRGGVEVETVDLVF